jgi:hypothetical protein
VFFEMDITVRGARPGIEREKLGRGGLGENVRGWVITAVVLLILIIVFARITHFVP